MMGRAKVREKMRVNVLDKVGFCQRLKEIKGMGDGLIRDVVNFVVNREFGPERMKYEGSNMNIILVDENEIRQLNARFRNMDAPTDVLSFSYMDEEDVGEVIICPEVVERNSREFKVPFLEEFFRVLIHGILHIVGYDHEDEEDGRIMFEKQENLLREVIDDLIKDSNRKGR